MSRPHSTPFEPGVFREHARAAIALVRAGASPTLAQTIALERIRVRMHGRANRHALGSWREDPAAPGGGELVACEACGARAFLSRETGVARIGEILEACK